MTQAEHINYIIHNHINTNGSKAQSYGRGQVSKPNDGGLMTRTGNGGTGKGHFGVKRV